ncbi:SRPBCC domain-containing protein [Thioclava sp. GXIMD4216]|uniref:SRPBCC domain-containing protein n=1 Tax=Thioclava sp. GXIMD4216 TaxID=3131929 RepID=UPI0030CABA0A
MDKITVTTTINAPVGTVWAAYTDAARIPHWNFATPDWHCPEAEVDLRVGGRVVSQMAAKDGSLSFAFGATYTEVTPPHRLAIRMDDGREAVTRFEAMQGRTTVTTCFDPETQNPVAMQQMGWQAILENFRRYLEG